MSRNLKIQLRNRYKLVRRDANLNVVEESGWSENLITDYGFDMLLTANSYVGLACVVGSGNSTPDESDEYLDSFVAGVGVMTGTVDAQYFLSTSPRHALYNTVWRINPTGSAYNASEVGICFALGSQPPPNNSSKVGSRSLVVDPLGSPTTVSVQGDEFLDVHWQYYIYVQEDSSGNATLTDDGTPVSTDYVVRGARMTGSSWPSISQNAPYIRGFYPQSGNSINNTDLYSTQVLGGYNSEPGGTALPSGFGAWTGSTYTPGSKTRNWTLRLNLNNGNHTGGIGSAVLALYGGFVQISFTPKLNKTPAKIGDLDFVITLSNV